ncbi:MAG: hypothetical protein V4714_10820 [Bacteroidota bacterium]
MKYPYQDLMRNFWIRHNSVAFGPSDIALYSYLVNSCDSGRWENPFTLKSGKITGDLGISDDTINAVKRKLKNTGLIDFETKKGSKYTTFFLPNLPKKTAGFEEAMPQTPQTSDQPPSKFLSDLPKKSGSLESTPIIYKQIELQIQRSVCAYFGFNEINHSINYFLALRFAHVLDGKNQSQYFLEQFPAYQQFKAISGEKTFAYKNFLGTPESLFQDGGWIGENWVNKLALLKKASAQKNQATASHLGNTMARATKQTYNDDTD